MEILNFSARQTIYKLFAVASIAALLGMVIGVSQVKAEYLYNVYVAGAGNVAIAATNGNYPVAGDLHGIGVSTSSTTLGYLYAENRNWHQSTDSDRTKIAKFKSWYNSTGGATSPDNVSNGYGDRSITQSVFLKSTPYQTTTKYTSYPNNSGSCANSFNTGNNC